MQYFLTVMVALAMLTSVVTVSAAEPADQAVADRIIAQLRLARPGMPVAKVQRTPLDGIYKVTVSGASVVYASADGNFLFTGKMLGVGPGEFVDVHEVDMIPLRRERMAQVALSDMVVFPAKGESKAYINVFTDVDCGYCRKLHQEVPALNANGIEVRYLAFPRAGIGSHSYKKIASAWCSDDPLDAMNRLKNGESIPTVSCQSPVAKQYNLGSEIGVSGTPAIVLADGTMLPGYLPADELIKRLNL
ncbi:MAG: DsbC family protein [Cellvibrionaceae bacterium]